jgi:Holliday junction DNA helicase RuvB P-loop domain
MGGLFSMIAIMSVWLRLGPFRISSRGRVGVRVGPVSVSGGGRRRKRRSPSNTRRSSKSGYERQIVEGERWLKEQAAAQRRAARSARRSSQVIQSPSTPLNRKSEAARLEAWLKATPPQLVLPGRFTQEWFAEHATNIHPGQIETLVDELVSRGWSREDIFRRAVPHLKRAALDRQVTIELHKRAEEQSAATRQIMEDRRSARRHETSQRRAGRSARWHDVFSNPARIWSRRDRGPSLPVEFKALADTTLSDCVVDCDISKVRMQADEAMTDTMAGPSTMTEKLGPSELATRLRIVMVEARQRETKPPHVLLSGPPGTDKTTPSKIVAHELGWKLITASGPALRRIGDLAGLLFSSNDDPAVLLIDEIHSLPVDVEETLYEALENGTFTTVAGSGNDAKSFVLKLPLVVIVGATTKPGALSQPLRDRFGFHATMAPYSVDESKTIVKDR